MGHVQDPPVSTNMISNICIPYKSTHGQLWFWPKQISKSKIHILPIYEQTDLKTAIVATVRKNWEQWKVIAIFETECFLNLSQEVSQKQIGV